MKKEKGMVMIMNRRKLSAFAVGISAAIFGILYPEYVLLPDTYEYIRIENIDFEETSKTVEEIPDYDSLEQLLWADPDQVVISSYFLEKLSDRGIVLWKSMDWNKVDMP